MANKEIKTISIESKILTIRGQKVMLDSDLAELYDVKTRELNQAVKRNFERFPSDFMFRLTQGEWQNLKSQFVISSWGGRRNCPYAFTEHGVAMLSSVLKSKRAIEINIQIIRAFIALRRYVLTQKSETIANRIGVLEKTILEYMDKNDTRVDEIVQTINDMLSEEEKTVKKIGFTKE